MLPDALGVPCLTALSPGNWPSTGHALNRSDALPCCGAARRDAGSHKLQLATGLIKGAND